MCGPSGECGTGTPQQISNRVAPTRVGLHLLLSQLRLKPRMQLLHYRVGLILNGRADPSVLSQRQEHNEADNCVMNPIAYLKSPDILERKPGSPSSNRPPEVDRIQARNECEDA